MAEDAGDRLAAEAPLGETVEAGDCLGFGLGGLVPEQTYAIQPEGRLGEEPRVEIRRVGVAGAKPVAHRPPALADGGHWMPSIAASSAA